MHGRPRKAHNPEDAAASAAKASKLRDLQSQFLSNHQNKIYTKEALDVSAKLLAINPESYTAWNYRKLAVEHRAEEIESILDEELRVVEKALEQNYKSYGAWHHRKWVLAKGHCSLDRELRLLDLLLKSDSRNFHAWNYRRFVTKLIGRSDCDELDYTKDMINKNFSNYSAWHNRSTLLSNLVKEKAHGFSSKEERLKEEYDFVHQGLFTEPDDQSGWFYHHWLLDQTFNAKSSLLISSFPGHGSDLIIPSYSSLDDFSSTLSTLHYGAAKFPVVLYFSQPMKGVNSSTITVESGSQAIKDINWEPLSINDVHSSRGWIAYLSWPDTAPMEISVSSSSVYCCQPFHFTFKVSVRPIETAPKAGYCGSLFSWRDENFLEVDQSSLILPLESLNLKNDEKPEGDEWQLEIIAKEINHFKELTEMDYKIGKLTLARLLTALDALMFPSTKKPVYPEEVLKLYTELRKSDPLHAEYYKDMESLTVLQKVTSSRRYLLEHCFCYKDFTSSSVDSINCVKLNNLSLSRLGSVENLLWVQILDLGHNEIRSIEGIEAMQLLSCLRLNNNKLCSLSALRLLTRLKYLRVLDISYNEIGSHSIDTAKYLFSSKSEHEKTTSSNINKTDYLYGLSVLEGLSLIQLDIAGNSIADDKFKSLLGKAMPSLKWLDGEQINLGDTTTRRQVV